MRRQFNFEFFGDMTMSQGSVVQCIGAVVDIQFPRDAMPKVYDALVLDAAEENPLVEKGLTFEVQQQLGDGVVRTIAMGSSDLSRCRSCL